MPSSKHRQKKAVDPMKRFSHPECLHDPCYPPIENYGIIGDTNTIALVGINGSIDFMSFPNHDSPTIFAAILDHKKGGCFKISPIIEDITHKQLYLSDTNVLLTRFLSDEGIGELSDFMPMEDDFDSRVIRRIKTVKGDMNYQFILDVKFDYGRNTAKIEKVKEGFLIKSNGKHKATLLLRTTLQDIDWNHTDGVLKAQFHLPAGETESFVLEGISDDNLDTPASHPHYVAESFKNTVNYWRHWVSLSTYRGRWREMMTRSALVLKLLTSRQHGSLIAAGTFGLPEDLGGERNWDYRYTWIRDAAFTLYAFMRLGYTEEAGAFMHWINKRCEELKKHSAENLQIMYGLDGRKDLEETTLPHLEGYRKSKPVRIGNHAYKHLQLDIYGELMDSIYLYDKYGEPLASGTWDNLVPLVNWVGKNWEREDSGIWEVRDGQKEFLYSRLLCWVAMDRAIRLARKRSFPAPLNEWIQIRDDIYKDIFKNFWNEKKQSFVQTKYGDLMDASLLLMPLVRFISPTDPKWLSTLKAIEEELISDSLVYRYRTDLGASDGLKGEEGTFSMCSFWYVECISRSGDVDKARFLFEKMLGHANHVGLYAEELGPRGEHLGNFPQAFTHLSLISAAYDINKNLDRHHAD